ncbi:SLC13 family permease [Parachlamydia sp. AcF125]|uniref:SLC13 family permease n=1 Tax=Parachlamydia sp. AcF125 TaxID=2795736 RepID=UPI001BCA45B6|nr:SLC13 family permease [Parachlamydia sp. AcF125]MBS4167805.1 putative transporter [Parachlamydia sp. AcF125]
MIALIIFVVCYLFFIFFPNRKAEVGLLGSLALIFLSQISWHTALFELVNWNVVGLFLGTLILAELFLLSRVPAVVSEWLVDRAKNVRSALMGIFILSSLLSMFVENVAVVLLVGPVAMTLCEKLKISAFKPMALLAMFSNLQGTATLIGDPPSMIMGGYMKMTFNDFFIYQGKPSIFFIVQAGAIGALVYAWYLLRTEEKQVRLIPMETVRSWIPALLLFFLVAILALGSFIDTQMEWLAGIAAMGLAFIGILWLWMGPRWASTEEMLRNIDWKTTLFFASLFILVGAVQQAGWMDVAAKALSSVLGKNKAILFIAIIGLSAFISAVVDNVPFLLAAIPVVMDLAKINQISLPFLMFALLIGTCLGGNVTPIGASANIVAMGFLEKKGQSASFGEYVPIGLKFTTCALIPAAIALWVIWA